MDWFLYDRDLCHERVKGQKNQTWYEIQRFIKDHLQIT